MEADQWENVAKSDQQSFCSLYDRTLKICLPGSLNKMKTVIAFGFFGLPKISEENAADLQEADSLYTCYGQQEKAIVDSVVEAIRADEYGGQVVYLRNTYLICKIEVSDDVEGDVNNVSDNNMMVCVYAFSNSVTRFKFVDICSRVYKDWSDFTDNNTLPPCKYCYPQNGIYVGKSEILFTHSPSSSFWHKVATYTDTVTGFGAVGSAVASLALTNPVGLSAALGVGVAAGAYGLGRSVYGLFDRASHSQSIGVNDAESRNYWINIVGAALTAGTTSAVAKSATLFQKYGTTATRGIMALNGITLAFDIAALGNSMYDLWVKRQEGETITVYDVFNISLQIMFLSGAIVNARQIHREMSNLSSGQVNKVMTKSQKKNARKKRALAKKKLDPNYVKKPRPRRKKNKTAKSSRVQTLKPALAKAIPSEHSSMFTSYLQTCPRLVFSILKQYYQPGEYIWQHFVSIVNNIRQFNMGELDLGRFLTITLQHLTNLYFILKEELSRLKPLLSDVNLFASENDKEDVCFVLDNAVTEINNLEAEINENNDSVDVEIKPVYAEDESVVRKRLSEMLRQFTFIVDNLFVVYSNDGDNKNQRVISQYQMSLIYVKTLIDTIDVILINLTEDNEQYAKDSVEYGLLIVALVKSKKDDQLFEDLVSVLASTVEDAFRGHFERLLSSHRTTTTSSNGTAIDFTHVDRVCDTIVEAFNLFVKTDEAPMLHKPELVLLKELLLQMLAACRFTNVSDQTMSLVLQQLHKDAQFGNYFKSLTIRTNNDDNPSVRLVNVESGLNVSLVRNTAKHKKLLEISCICYYKLMKSGFDTRNNDVGYIFNLVIDFVKSKLLDMLKTNYGAYDSNLYIFNLLTDDLASRCIWDDILLGECIEFCSTRLDSKKDILIWEDIINDIGIEVNWYYNLDYIILDDHFLRRLVEKFDIHFEDVCVLRNADQNIITIRPRFNGTCGDLEMIIVCKIPRETGGFIVRRKKTIEPDVDSDASDDSDDNDD